MTEPPDPTCIVADVDVLAADLFIDGFAREALSMIRETPALSLVLTDTLIDQTVAVIEHFGDTELADTWEHRVRTDFETVEPVLAGHPGLVAAAAASAGTLLSHDERLQRARAGVAIRARVATSVKSPRAFVSIVDPSTLDFEK